MVSFDYRVSLLKYVKKNLLIKTEATTADRSIDQKICFQKFMAEKSSNEKQIYVNKPMLFQYLQEYLLVSALLFTRLSPDAHVSTQVSAQREKCDEFQDLQGKVRLQGCVGCIGSGMCQKNLNLLE